MSESFVDPLAAASHNDGDASAQSPASDTTEVENNASPSLPQNQTPPSPAESTTTTPTTTAAATTTPTTTTPPVSADDIKLRPTGNTMSMSLDKLADYLTNVKNIYTKISKAKDVESALTILLQEEHVDAHSVIGLPDEFDAEKAAFWDSMEKAWGSGKRTETIHHTQRLLRDIKEIELLQKFANPLLQVQKDKGKKHLKLIAECIDGMKKFLERILVPANTEFLEEQLKSEEMKAMRRYFENIDELLQEKNDLLWYANHYEGEQYKYLSTMEGYLDQALKMEYTNNLPIDEKTAKNVQKVLSSNLSKLAKELQNDRKLHQAVIKLGIERGTQAVSMGLMKLFQQIYDTMTNSILNMLPENDRVTHLITLAKRKEEYVGKRNKALAELRAKDLIFKAKLEEAADKLRPAFKELLATANQQGGDILEYQDIDCEQIFTQHTIDQYKGKKVVFNALPSGLLGEAFKGPEGNGYWDTTSFAKEIKRENDWKAALKVFESIQAKVLKTYGLPESVQHITYGFYDTGDDDLNEYMQHRPYLYPFEVLSKPTFRGNGNGDSNSNYRRTVSKCVATITGKRVNRITVKASRTLEDGSAVDDVEVAEAWPCVTVSFLGVEEPYAVWVNGKCSLALADFKQL